MSWNKNRGRKMKLQGAKMDSNVGIWIPKVLNITCFLFGVMNSLASYYKYQPIPMNSCRSQHELVVMDKNEKTITKGPVTPSRKRRMGMVGDLRAGVGSGNAFRL